MTAAQSLAEDSPYLPRRSVWPQRLYTERLGYLLSGASKVQDVPLTIRATFSVSWTLPKRPVRDSATSALAARRGWETAEPEERQTFLVRTSQSSARTVARNAGDEHTTRPGSAELSFERCSPTLLHSTPTSPILLALSDVAGFELYMA
ncbi:hypothetical protein VTO73DRAFT_12139 [Trametes versicolor]